ncbi:MAG: CHAT domain-containing protein [Planctomycetota bacterium]
MLVPSFLRSVAWLIFGLVGHAWAQAPNDTAAFEERWPRAVRQLQVGELTFEAALPLLDEAARNGAQAARYELGVAIWKTHSEGSPEQLPLQIRVLEHIRDAAHSLPKWAAYQWACLSLSRAARGAGDIAESARLLEESCRAVPADKLAVENAIDLAELRSFLGEVTASLEWLDRARARLPEAPATAKDLRRLVHIQQLRAQHCLTLGLIDRAAIWLERADRTTDELRQLVPAEPREVLQAAIYRSNFLLATDRYSEVVRTIDDLLGQRIDLANIPGALAVLRVRLGIALFRLERRDPERTRRAGDVLRLVIDDPTAQPNDVRSATIRLAQVALWDAHFDECERWLEKLRTRERVEEQTGSSSPIDDAILSALASRFATRSQALPEEQARCQRDLEGRLDAMLAEWESQQARTGGVSYLYFGHVAHVVGELMSRAVEAGGTGGAIDALEIFLRLQELGALYAQLGPTTVSVERIREQLLRPGQGMLLWYPAIESSFVFAIDSDTVIVREVAPRDILDEARCVFLGQLFEAMNASPAEAAGAARAVEPGARELARTLLPPDIVARVVEWAEVIVVAPDVLGYVPFECLILGEGREPLGLAKPVSYLPSFSVGLRLVERATSVPGGGAGPQGLVLANPSHSAEARARFPDLEPLRVDVDAVTAPWGIPVKVLEGDRASRAQLFDATSRATAFLQIFAHGVQDPDRERSPGLILAPSESDSGLVWGDSLESLDVPPLVILCACGTGRGPERRGDPDVTSLSGTLLARGANCVVLPHAAIYDRATLDLMTRFDRALAQGEPPARALHIARRAISSDRRMTPAFLRTLLHVRGLGWAASPVGVHSLGPSATPSSLWWSVAVGVIGLILTLVWRARRRSRVDSDAVRINRPV